MAALRRRLTLFPFLLVLVSLSVSSLVFGDWISDDEREQFTEELLLKPLPDRKVLAHFHFQSTAYPSPNSGHHHRLFPKAIAQLLTATRPPAINYHFQMSVIPSISSYNQIVANAPDASLLKLNFQLYEAQNLKHR